MNKLFSYTKMSMIAKAIKLHLVFFYNWFITNLAGPFTLHIYPQLQNHLFDCAHLLLKACAQSHEAHLR